MDTQQHLTPEVALDDSADVLYVRYPHAFLANSREAPSDSYLILNEGPLGEIIGVQVMYASDLVEGWAEHPDRSVLPAALTRAIDEWVASRH